MPASVAQLPTKQFLCVYRGSAGQADLAYFQFPGFSAIQFRAFVDAFKAYWQQFSGRPKWDGAKFYWEIVSNPSVSVWDDFCQQVGVEWYAVVSNDISEWRAWKTLKSVGEVTGYYIWGDKPADHWVSELGRINTQNNQSQWYGATSARGTTPPTGAGATHGTAGGFTAGFATPPPGTGQTTNKQSRGGGKKSSYGYTRPDPNNATPPPGGAKSSSFGGRQQSTKRPEEPSGNTHTDALLYSVLHLTPGAPDELITAAYKRLATLYHPDKGGDEVKMQEVNRAYGEIKTKRGMK